MSIAAKLIPAALSKLMGMYHQEGSQEVVWIKEVKVVKKVAHITIEAPEEKAQLWLAANARPAQELLISPDDFWISIDEK